MFILKGLPGSGKSTLARKMYEDSQRETIIINWDSISAANRFSKFKEVKALSQTLAATAISKGQDVIIDNTNLTPKTLDEWGDLATVFGAKVEVINVDTSLAECIRRDSLRTKPVGRAVIERMALFAGLIEFDPTKKLVIFDMDGTLASCRNRVPYLQQMPKDHKAFYKDVVNDEPIEPVLSWAKAFKDSTEYDLVIVSGRPTDLCGEGTDQWLTKYDVPSKYLFMRNRGDYRDDTVVKMEILAAIGKDKVEFVVDDRPKVIRAWREAGVKVYPVGPGEEF